ncbi:MAG TPA: tRNA lysidine(34) synthetase TilS [Actinomycetes bacterium]|nr:tRNA lysidine(34) synthetase TilS [Actinomycetes bacterium]
MTRVADEVLAVRREVRAALAGLAPGSLVLVACSGGPDSVALAAALAHEAPRAGLTAGGVTVDHGLQPGSADRAAVVAEQLRALGLAPVEVAAVDATGPEGGPEAAARTARYAALDALADRLGAAAVLLGHTLDDQAETVLLGLARGSGARSLAGMAAARGPYRRPLLGLPRAVVRAAADGHRTWEDPHNADPAYARARARHDALPALERALGPGVAAALARTADLLRDDADALDEWAERALVAATVDDGLDVAALAALPAALRTRVIRRAALAAGSPASALSAAQVAGLDRLVTDWHGQGPLDLPGGVAAARACGTLAFSRQSRRTDRRPS